MGIRERGNTARRLARRNFISRTVRVWTKINRSLVSELKEITQEWLEKFIRKAEKEITTGYINEVPELPKKFSETLLRKLRYVLAQGYWLNHVYLQEIRASQSEKKYRGKITLSDLPDDEILRGELQNFINVKSSDTWDKVIPVEAVNFLDNYVPKLAGNLRQEVLEKTREVIRQSMIDGSTLKERMKALRESSNELSRMTDRRIEAIARTEITRADTYGRLISMKQNDDVIGVEFSAILDDRTTPICESRDGLLMRLDDPRLPENMPPCHVNCRSLLLPVTVYDFPDGLLTSHEFDEAPSSNQRPEDILEVEKILQALPNSEAEEPEAAPIFEIAKNSATETETEQKKAYEIMKGLSEKLKEIAAQFSRLNGIDRDGALNDAEKLIIGELINFVSPEVAEMLSALIAE